MYWNILKKDLKRKKTMNLILLLFSMLASMFVSSGMNNVITVMNGTDYYLEKAGIGDYMVITQNGDGGVADILEQSDYVTSYKKEECFWTSKDDIKINSKRADMKNNTVVVQGYSEDGITYFHEDNSKLTEVPKGDVYVTAGFLKLNSCKIGDELSINIQDVYKEFVIAGEIKDALLGSDMMGNIRLIINEEDYQAFEENEKLVPYSGSIFYVNSDDVTNLAQDITAVSNLLFSGTKDTIKICYVMEMIVAMVVLVLSVLLCIISFVLLKFVINFSINEEYREIGVMKAIGIRNWKIRSLFITKYFFIALFGGIAGFVLGIPFGNMLLQSVSQKMYLGNDAGIAFNVLGSVVVVLIMIGFAYLCTSKVKKYTPVDAIRDGQQGERYGKRSKFSIKKMYFGNVHYLAINDILSAPRRYLTIILTFFLSSVFVFGVVMVYDTMNSDRLITTLGKKSDVYITDSKVMKMDIMGEKGNTKLIDALDKMENELAEMGMPADVSMEVWYRYPVSFNGKTVSVTFQQNCRTSTTEYEYEEGTAPENANEIAVTRQVAKEIGVKIGDIVTIDFDSEKKECMVVAYFQTMNQLGSVIRLHEDAPTSMEYSSAMMSFQIDFKDDIDKKEIEDRIEEIKEYYDIEDIYDAKGYCDNCIGVGDTMRTVSLLLLIITGIVVILVTVLMEISFISDETRQIALLKSMGFTDAFVIRWHVERFMLIGIFSEIIAIALTYPITKLWCDPIWKMMGANHVSYYFNPISLIIVYPGIILIVNFISVWVTARYTKKITSNQMQNIE